MTMLGKKHSVETRKKISIIQIGRKLSDETKKKMSLAHKGSNHYFYGKQLTKEHIEKIRIGKKKAKGLLEETEEERRVRYAKYKKNYILKNIEKVREMRRNYILKNIEKVREMRRISKKKSYEKNPQKVLARNLTGKLIPIQINQLCEICNKNKAEHRHHLDYSKPLQINFVCVPCHKELHRKT